ncbi:MAG: thymidine phosphorylase, partial [Ruegeria sp.]
VMTDASETPLGYISAELGGVLLADAGVVEDAGSGRERILKVIRDGRAAERFGQMMAAVGGPVRFVDTWERFLPEASVIQEVPALMKDGFVTAIDGEALGLAVVALGGGRQVESDVIDPAVGFSNIVRLGDKVSKGMPLAVVHAAREGAAKQATQSVTAAITIGKERVVPPSLVHERIGL